MTITCVLYETAVVCVHMLGQAITVMFFMKYWLILPCWWVQAVKFILLKLLLTFLTIVQKCTFKNCYLLIYINTVLNKKNWLCIKFSHHLWTFREHLFKNFWQLCFFYYNSHKGLLRFHQLARDMVPFPPILLHPLTPFHVLTNPL